MTREEQINEAVNTYMNGLFEDGVEISIEDYENIEEGFIAGAEWADEHPISSWISVKEELPYNNPNFIHFGFTNRVLVRDKKWNVFVAYMKKNKDNKWIWYSDIDDNFNLLSYITHWMYIPKIEKD